jgi:hypothetical protein
VACGNAVLGAGSAVPVTGLARRAGLGGLAGRHVKAPTGKGADPAGKVMAIVAGMAMGADPIDDLGVVRAGFLAPRRVGGFNHDRPILADCAAPVWRRPPRRSSAD